jgi:uncharacterized membrane protein (UPF0127 family)
MKYSIVIIILIIALAGYFYHLEFYKPILVSQNKSINLEVARTQSSREKGLSNRVGLPNNTGLLFIFPSLDQQYFWNQDMKFPIDVIWFENNKIIGISSLPIDKGDNITISSPGKVNRVLELPANSVEKYDLKAGQTVSFRNLPNAE